MKHIVLITPLFVLALLVNAVAQENGPRPRLISVSGTSEINVPPDQVVLRLGIESRDRVLRSAKAQNDARSKKVIALASTAGIESKDIQTSELQMNPTYSEERVPKFVDFEVTQTIAITLKDLSKYDALMTKLLESGVNRVDGISFEVGETRKYKDEARSKAIQAAKEKAVAMATELGQTIGKPWEISEQDGENPFTPTPIMMANSVIGGAGYDRSDAKESTVAPGQVTIRASVRVSFQLE
jgi:uncharacterized protein YggE